MWKKQNRGVHGILARYPENKSLSSHFLLHGNKIDRQHKFLFLVSRKKSVLEQTKTSNLPMTFIDAYNMSKMIHIAYFTH